MIPKVVFFLFVVFTCGAIQTFAADECKKGKFLGSYARVQQLDPLGDGNTHTYLQQLTLHSDGSVEFFFSGFPDYTLNIGTGTPGAGSWMCRPDDKLVVTVFANFYVPQTVNGITDLVLFRNLKDTYLFTITDQDTLTREQFRRRQYLPDQDPTNPAIGTLGPLNTAAIPYKRLIASDADLLAP